MSLIQSKAIWAVALCALLAIYFAPDENEGGVPLSDRALMRTDRMSAPAVDAQMHVRAPMALGDIAERVQLGERAESWRVMGERQRPDEIRISNAPSREVKTIAMPAQPQDASASSIEAIPQPPPLPFRYLGRVEIDGNESAFLQYRDQNLVVKTGDTIAALYRINSMSASSIEMTYLPLNAVQRMAAEQP